MTISSTHLIPVIIVVFLMVVVPLSLAIAIAVMTILDIRDKKRKGN